MPVRKTFIKTGVVALLPVLLSGCGLPIGVTIAGWAVDGISLISTEKSVADHGISALAQRDCALWRVFKGESICRDAVSEGIQVADASGVPVVSKALKSPADDAGFEQLTIDDVAATVSKPVQAADVKSISVKKASTVELAIIEMEAHQSATLATAAGSAKPSAAPRSTSATAPGKPIPLPGVEQARNNRSQVSQGAIRIADAEGGSGLMSRPLPPPAPSMIEPVKTSNLKERLRQRRSARPASVETLKVEEKPIVRKMSAKSVTTEKPATYEPVVEFETPKPATVQKPKRAVREHPAPVRQKQTPAVRQAVAGPGLYYVLGSFAVEANAHRMARKAAKLQPKVVAAMPKGKRVLRVLVGPFTKAEQSRIQAKIRAADIRGTWVLRMKTAMKTERIMGAQLAALGR